MKKRSHQFFIHGLVCSVSFLSATALMAGAAPVRPSAPLYNTTTGSSGNTTTGSSGSTLTTGQALGGVAAFGAGIGLAGGAGAVTTVAAGKKLLGNKLSAVYKAQDPEASKAGKAIGVLRSYLPKGGDKTKLNLKSAEQLNLQGDAKVKYEALQKLHEEGGSKKDIKAANKALKEAMKDPNAPQTQKGFFKKVLTAINPLRTKAQTKFDDIKTHAKLAAQKNVAERRAAVRVTKEKAK